MLNKQCIKVVRSPRHCAACQCRSHRSNLIGYRGSEPKIIAPVNLCEPEFGSDKASAVGVGTGSDGGENPNAVASASLSSALRLPHSRHWTSTGDDWSGSVLEPPLLPRLHIPATRASAIPAPPSISVRVIRNTGCGSTVSGSFTSATPTTAIAFAFISARLAAARSFGKGDRDPL